MLVPGVAMDPGRPPCEARTPFSQIPAQVDPYLDHLRLWEDGHVLLCSSSLASRYWRGSAWIFSEPELAPDVNKCITGVEVDSGVGDALVLNSKQFVVGVDSGAVLLMEVVGGFGNAGGDAGNEPSPPSISTMAESTEHDDCVSCLGLVTGKGKIISGSFDKSIKLWDVESVTVVKSYPMAHYRVLSGISPHPRECDVLASCGEDGRVMMWDTRLPKPATELESISPDEAAPTAITWIPNQTSQLTIGDQRGVIRIRDVRQHNQIIQESKLFNRSIHRLQFSQQDPHVLAACAEHTCVQAIDVSPTSMSIRYYNDDHTDFVRSIAWHPKQPNVMYSCGWDKRVRRHYIGQNPQDVRSSSLMDTNGVRDS